MSFVSSALQRREVRSRSGEKLAAGVIASPRRDVLIYLGAVATWCAERRSRSKRRILGKRLVMVTVARTPTAKAAKTTSIRLAKARTAKKR